MRRRSATPVFVSAEELVARVLADLAEATRHASARWSVETWRDYQPPGTRSTYSLGAEVTFGGIDVLCVRPKTSGLTVDGDARMQGIIDPGEAFQLGALLFSRLAKQWDEALLQRVRELALGDAGDCKCQS